MDTHLFFHNDIDGIITAAMYMAFDKHEDEDDIITHPVQSSCRGSVFQNKINEINCEHDNIVIVDYEYSSKANLWIDHHYSDKFGHAPVFTKNIIYDPHSASAASIYLNHLQRTCYSDFGIANLIKQVDMIDVASYADIRQFFEDKSPIMCLSAYLETEFPSTMMFCRIVEMFARKSLNINRAMKCLEIDKRYVDNLIIKAKAASKVMVIYQNFSVIELQRPNQYPRYSEYYHKPELQYTIRMSRVNNGKDLYIQIGANKWCSTKNEINIGLLMNSLSYKKTGGGHFHVGGCTIGFQHKERFLDDMCIYLNKDTEMAEMEKYGVAPDDPIEQEAAEMVKTGQASNMKDAREKTQRKNGDPKKDEPTAS